MKTKILKSVELANKSYLKKVLSLQTDPTKKEQIKILFTKHMQEISDFCIENFIKKDKLTEKFIRDLHKLHFPPWYKKTKKTLSWDGEVVVMLPWVYKSSPTNYNWVAPSEVKFEMQKLIENYNENIDLAKNKFDFILNFVLDFYKIHPFWDWNGRIASILWDLMLIKNNLKPIFIKTILDNKTNKEKLFEIIEVAIRDKKIDIFIKEIKKLILN